MMAAESKDKNGTNYILIGLALIIALASVTYVGVAVMRADAHHLRTISVSSTGVAMASPAAAMVQITVNATGTTVALANANLSSIIGQLNTTLLPYINRNLSNVETTYYTIYPATTCVYPANATPLSSISPYYCVLEKLPYYVATESITITVPNIDNSSAALSAISAVPSLTLNGVQAQLSVTQERALGQLALSNAMANATTQAQLLAGSGVELKVENITVTNSQLIYPGVYSSAGTVKDAARVIYGGQASVQKSVSVVFSIS
ncbi:Uncharacterised protein [uncultured archaeon]|nr:Uncharacterised protein [uncultured archaeon]